MKILLFFSILVIGITSCSQSNKKEYKITNSSKIILTLKRGAFHYDKFVLNDTIITYYPSLDTLGKEYKKYNRISKQKISRETRNQFIKYIVENGFFNLKKKYSNNSSCNSHVSIKLELNKQSKKITSEDFQRGCPELIKYIENELVRMHNKGLKRIFLPG